MARLVAHLGGFLTVDDRGGALNARVVALDGERPARCPGEFRSPQRARSASRFVQEEPQVLSQSADHGQHALVDVPQGWGGVNHTADIIKVIMDFNR